ncbi:hypothetical protein OZX62_01170 [Bifidobacterium sp. ESL0690]|uniref:hypothetical protein n=1 Tax=Bifidobacterium sp. ESL0690 TaxID=2983214 RepID=UPI0023F685AD|nr:hypothetical protein [Bifidobacterium sp. ESL0690]WEV46939.1 hypothetical protein OZX62_01170 [Bifidobacterium sp. ESL0690]
MAEPFESSRIQQMRYPLPADVMFEQIRQMLESSKFFRLRSVGPQPLSCVFSTHVSLTAWGEYMNAVVIPDAQGSVVNVKVNANFSTLMQGRRNRKDMERFFTDLNARIDALYHPNGGFVAPRQ